MLEKRILDITDPEAIHKELFHDNLDIVIDYKKHFSKEILEFSVCFSKASIKYEELHNLAIKNGDNQSAFVSGITQLILDNLFTSFKLYIFGFQTPSGNLFRHVIEAIALAILCSLKDKIQIHYRKKNKDKIKHIHFFNKFRKNRSITQSYKAFTYLENNSQRLGINEEALNVLKITKKNYHGFSHPSLMTLATNMSFEERGKTYIGGSFDIGKIDIYSDEIGRRINICKVLPNIFEALIYKTKELAIK